MSCTHSEGSHFLSFCGSSWIWCWTCMPRWQQWPEVPTASSGCFAKWMPFWDRSILPCLVSIIAIISQWSWKDIGNFTWYKCCSLYIDWNLQHRSHRSYFMRVILLSIPFVCPIQGAGYNLRSPTWTQTGVFSMTFLNGHYYHLGSGQAFSVVASWACNLLSREVIWLHYFVPSEGEDRTRKWTFNIIPLFNFIFFCFNVILLLLTPK